MNASLEKIATMPTADMLDLDAKKMSSPKFEGRANYPSKAHAPHIRRADYMPAANQEKFIVPLLRNRIEAHLRAHRAPQSRGHTALDVGCGRQPFRGLLEEVGYSYRSLDVSQNPENTVDFIGPLDGDLLAVINPSRTFDFLLCTEVLEHVADWRKAFSNLASLAAPGAIVLITCPHFYQLHEEPHDYWRPTLNALRYHSQLAGFETLHEEAAGDGWDVLGTVLANLQVDAKSRRFVDRATAKIVRKGIGWLFNNLLKKTLKRRVMLHSPLYLSNIVILERC